MIRRMTEKGLLARERTEVDARANAVRIAPGGRKALRRARAASERVEKALLSSLSAQDRTRLVKMLSAVVAQAEAEGRALPEPPPRRTRRR
jgi:DNA-binding MarR family transcriptional regulator